MIAPDKRRAIYMPYQEGLGVRRIARQLNVSINTMRSIIDQQGGVLCPQALCNAT